MSAPAILILGGNRMLIPAIQLLRDDGYEVVVLDRSPTAPAQSAASRFIPVDFSRLDATREAIAGIELAAVMPVSDFGVRTAAAIATERRLRGADPETAYRLTNKVAMKQAFQAAGLPTAQWTWGYREAILAGEFPSWDRFPCIVKPAFSGGGSRGVGLAKNWDDVRAIVASGERVYVDHQVVIEEFIEGTEHTIEMLIDGDRGHLLSISDKENYPGSFTVVQKLYFPGPIGHAHRHLVEPLVLAGAKALGLACGTTHTEILIKDGKPYLLEVGGRPGGGINFHPICQISAGYCYPRLYAAVLLGKPLQLEAAKTSHLAWHYFDHGPGIVRRIEGFDGIASEPDVVDAEMYDREGAPALDKHDDLARPGYVLVSSKEPSKARRRAAQLAERVRFVIE